MIVIYSSDEQASYVPFLTRSNETNVYTAMPTKIDSLIENFYESFRPFRTFRMVSLFSSFSSSIFFSFTLAIFAGSAEAMSLVRTQLPFTGCI